MVGNKFDANNSEALELTKITTITAQITVVSKINKDDLPDIIRDDEDTKAYEDKLKEFLGADDVIVTSAKNFVLNK